MQKIWAVILLSALASNYEALPQTKWSRPIRNIQGQLTRERRQFPFGDWIPLSQSCPTCRLFADPLDAGLRGENIGLTPPRPPTVTRQIHSESSFFPQDESSILSVPPPPPSIATSGGSFQFSGFGQQFNNPSLPTPTQKIVPQTQQIQFFPQTFLPNQPLLVNGNQQILSGLNSQSNLFVQGQQGQQLNNGKVTTFQNTEFKTQKLPENVVLEQNKRPIVPKPFANKPQTFTQPQQNQQQAFGQQQALNGQRQHSVDFGSTILTPPPAPNNVSQDIVIPGLDKEEIQLLYVPVETLRQRGSPQEQLLTQQPQNIQFQNIQYNRPNGPQRPVNNIRPTEQTLVSQSPKGHFLTQNGNNAGQSDSTIKVTSVQPFSTSVTPSSLLLQHLPFQETPQPFVSATPATPTIQPFVTPASVFQKFSPFTPETTLPQLSTVSNNVQFSQSGVDFGTTPKTITNQGVFAEGIINNSPAGFSNQERDRPLQRPLQQSIVTQQQVLTNQPQQNAVFTQEHQKEIHAQNQFPNQIDQNQIALQKQQENQRLLQQQRQKELDERRFLEEQRKQKELEEQRLIQQQRQKELEEQRLLQKQKELEEQRLLQQQQRQKELEQQRFLQKQKELEEQRLLQQQQRQKELEQQRFLQKQKELEEQRLLQQQQRQKELEQQRFLQKQKELEQQRFLQQQQLQKELEQQRFLQQQRQKELEEQRILQEQRQKELEQQRRLQLQKQKELEEKRLLQQLKQKEEEQQRLLRFQQQQKELEQQKLLQAQQENQQRLLQQQKLLQKQKQENLKNQQQFQLFQQQQKQNLPQQPFQQPNRHVLPSSDKLNLIPELEKESEDQQLVPHQPPLSVFFKGYNGAEARITDVLRELRSSNTITVLDQYFEKMPKVFVGPAGLIPPAGYGKFDLPYLSNLESNRIDRRIDKLPFFVAPLNFVPPPGYAKIPFPAPHVGSVVVSSESNPAMKLKSVETGTIQPSVEEENVSGSYPVVGPELPGLINNLDPITTTAIPTTFVTTPSLPQTTAQLRNRRPSSGLYKPQNRKPITRTRSSTTSKPEEEVTQSTQKAELNKESEGIRKPFNRFSHRRRQQIKTTTESALKSQQEGKNLENRFYSVEVYHQDQNQVPRTQVKSDVIRENPLGDQQQHRQPEHSIDRITPGGHGVFEVRPTPDYSATHQTAGPVESEERSQDTSDYYDLNLQTFEDGPLPTGSAKTITQELYRPNIIGQPEAEGKPLSNPDGASDKSQSATYEDTITTKFAEIPDASPTAADDKETISDEQVSLKPTLIAQTEKQDASSEGYYSTEAPRGEVSFTPRPVTAAGDYQTKGFLGSNEQYTSAFAEISKYHHIPGFSDSSKRQPSTFSDAYPTSEISVDLQAPLSQDFSSSSEVRPTENAAGSSSKKFLPTGSSYESYSTSFEGVSENRESDISSSQPAQVSPTASTITDGQYTAGFSVNSQANRNSDDERTPSFISLGGIAGSQENSQQFLLRSTPQTTAIKSNPPVIVQNHVSSTPEPPAEVTVNPSAQTYVSGSVEEKFVQHNDQTQVTEGHSQDFADNLPNDHRLKLPNPSIVRVRTRARGKSRGQINFAASQSTTSPPFTRSGTNTKHNENEDQDLANRTNHFRDYHSVKTSKFNQFRGVKKPVRPTTEATTEYEQKNVYTIRPYRRPSSPSTVSTKRIRKPTTPIPSAETATEVFGIHTVASQSQPEHSDISPSGVSNDVYYEQSSLSPVKSKFRKHFGPAEQKNDVVPVYSSTAFPSTYSTTAYDGYSEESSIVGDLVQAVPARENSDKYPEWNPSESGFDVSGIVLTTIRTSSQEEQSEVEEPKKAQDSKKAFDPDLEKKTGRRRVRVRVHKRPHENFETAESQNLRTVANVLVPPTTTYKPNDESSFHQLAKNADFSFGGQKLFGVRSREYFRKRLNLNLTESEGVNKGEQSDSKNSGRVETAAASKSQTNEVESVPAPSSESSEGNKIARPKFRGFVRKIVKHGGVRKDKESESNQLADNEENEGKRGSGEFPSRQPIRVNQGVFNHTGRINGTKHKTFVRFVKKNKVRQHETEVNSNFEEVQKEGEGLRQSDADHQQIAQTSEATQTTAELQVTKDQQAETEKITETQQDLKQEKDSESQRPEATEEPEVKETQHPLSETVKATTSEESQTSEDSSHSGPEVTTSNAPPTTPLIQQTVLNLTQRPKFFQTSKPIFQRTSALYRTRESEAPPSTTEQVNQEPQERRNFSRFKYGKTTGASTARTEKTDEIKKATEQLTNKNLHTLEVRKYLRTKSREGAFSQFSRNRYSTSEKIESGTIKDQTTSEKETEEFTTERNNDLSQTETSSVEPKTTQLFLRTDTTEAEVETIKTDDELPVTTTEVITSSEEESSEEEDEVTSSVDFETTTETEIPTTAFRASSTETPEKVTTQGTQIQTTETQPDIYRFSKDSFSFDETEKFTGTKNRAYVRNITTDIIENTASFSAPGVERRPDIRVVKQRIDEVLPGTTDSGKEKTEGPTTELSASETTTGYPEVETTATAEAITKTKVAKVLKTSTTTKISHETEICYRGKCIRTKSENPDEDLKLLVDSASTMKIEKTKT